MITAMLTKDAVFRDGQKAFAHMEGNAPFSAIFEKLLRGDCHGV